MRPRDPNELAAPIEAEATCEESEPEAEPVPDAQALPADVQAETPPNEGKSPAAVTA